MNVEEIAFRLMRHPAAPYHEALLSTEIRQLCAESGLDCQEDEFGNLLVSAGRFQPPDGRFFIMAAHMDHPGFEILGTIAPGRWRAKFLGGVPEVYFKEGVPVRLHPGNIAARLAGPRDKDGCCELVTEASHQASLSFQYAVWDLPAFEVRQSRIHGRACDDLVGAASALAALIQLRQRQADVPAIALLSRAEEVGFQGALAAAASGTLPAGGFIISLETSREMPPIRMGGGVILRVGDRSSVFHSRHTRFLAEVALELAARDPSFQWQRALMSGGTCEATAFQELGFESAALCVALGNYHNCAAETAIAAEYVDVADADGMVRLLTTAASQLSDYDRLTGKLNSRLQQNLQEARARLKRGEAPASM